MTDIFPPQGAFLNDAGTQTIGLTDLFTHALTTTGSFDVSGGIWKTTFGKVIQVVVILRYASARRWRQICFDLPDDCPL